MAKSEHSSILLLPFRSALVKITRIVAKKGTMPMSFRSILLAAAAGATLSAASPASANFTIDWATMNGDTTASPLVVPASDGNTATFTSTANPNNGGFGGTFAVSDTGFYDGFTYGLGDSLSFYGDTLTISFANPIAGGVSFPFGIEDAFGLFGGDFLTISSNTGVTAIATTALDGGTLDEPEGNAYIDAPGATVLTITSGPSAAGSNPFDIGDVTVPEPISLSIFGVGLAGLTAARRRRT
jgi:PEP-CTERM motif